MEFNENSNVVLHVGVLHVGVLPDGPCARMTRTSMAIPAVGTPLDDWLLAELGF